MTKLSTANLVGIQFEHGRNDCYELIRRFYRDNFNLQLRNYARPDNWWDGVASLNLYQTLYIREGFLSVNAHPTEWRPTDALLFSIRSRTPNHVGILLPGNNMLHHLYGRLSTIEPLSGTYRNLLMGVVRHPDVNYEPEIKTTHLMEIHGRT